MPVSYMMTKEWLGERRKDYRNKYSILAILDAHFYSYTLTKPFPIAKTCTGM